MHPCNSTFLLWLWSPRPLRNNKRKSGAMEVGDTGACAEHRRHTAHRLEGRRARAGSRHPPGLSTQQRGALTWDGLREDDSGGAVPGRKTVSGSRLNDTRFLAVGLGGHRWS